MKKILLASLVALLFTTSASAGWLAAVTPKQVRAMSNGGLTGITFSSVEAIQGPASCDHGFYHVEYDANGHHKDVLAILLSAIAMGKTVSIYIVDTACSSSGRTLVTDVMLE